MPEASTIKPVPPIVQSMAQQASDKPAPLPLVTDVMNDKQYDETWVKSIARNGRSDEEMKALEPSLDAYRLGEKSDLISYHRKPAKQTQDLVS